MKPSAVSLKAVGVVATGLLVATLLPGSAMAAQPSAPTLNSATPYTTSTGGRVTLAYTAVTASPAVTGYTATATPTGGGTAVPTSCGNSTVCVVNGLTNGTAYSFTVHATNTDGTTPDSAESNAIVATPSGVPGAPSNVTATAGSGQATVSWTAPNANGSAITGYTVSASGSGGQTCTTSTTSCSVTGLTNSTAYTFTVTATNANGTGTTSAASNSVTPAAVPGAPTIGTATAANGSASVTFTAPSANGSAITGYTVTSSPGGLTSSGCTSSPCSVTGLTNGTAYTFTVTATNGAGTGTASAASNSVTPATVPGAPTGVSAARGNASATVSWTAPASNGSSITGYTVASVPSSAGCTTTSATSCAVSGLTNGTAYTFTVTATNAVGTSSASTASPAVTPVAVPGAPGNLAATGSNRMLSLSFNAPASSGGAPITGYQVSIDGGLTWHGLTTSGSAPLIASYSPVLNGQTYPVSVRAVNSIGTGTATASLPTVVSTSFVDPISASTYAHEVKIPTQPRYYRGPKKHTKATYRSADNTPATTLAALHGRELQPGQAVQVLAGQLFRSGTATLNSAGRTKLATLALSLTYVSAGSCEGYSDYSYGRDRARNLARYRASVVCRALVADGAPITGTSSGDGASRPTVIGGKARGYSANNRVVFVATS